MTSSIGARGIGAMLFVDCRETLYTTRRTFRGSGGEAWQPNWDVVAAIERWQAQGRGDVMVWSERGEEDARQWAARVIPHLVVRCGARDIKLPRLGDVLIDDERPAVRGGVCYRPAQSFMVAPNPTNLSSSPFPAG